MPDRSKAYTEAGVDLKAADTLVGRLKNIVAQTHIHGVMSDIGGFGGLFKPDIADMKEPILTAATDGVGTKLKLAFAFNKHDSIGIDLVAMSVNDILVQGAKPLFFLDYFATGKLDVDTAEAVIKGVAAGCKEAGCALLGGETAEMPDMYAPGEYDLAGFCVGIADREKIIEGTNIQIGDAIIGLASSGLHSNGYSLVRKVFAESGLGPDDTLPGSPTTLRRALLEPTAIYVKPVQNILRDFQVKGMAHITGGGFYDNIPRVLPKGVAAQLDLSAWAVPEVFLWLMRTAKLTWPEMLQIFNCGVGYILVVRKEEVGDVVERLAGMGCKAWKIGEVIKAKEPDCPRVIIDFDESCGT